MARLRAPMSVPAGRRPPAFRSKNDPSLRVVSVGCGPRARGRLLCPLRGGAVRGLCRWCGGGRSGGVARAVGIRIVDAGASDSVAD